MMKVVPNPALIEKCDSSNISDFDIAYMTKLNKSLSANGGGDLKYNSHDTKINSEALKSLPPNTVQIGDHGVNALLNGCAIANGKLACEDLNNDDAKPPDDDEQQQQQQPSSSLSSEGEKLPIHGNLSGSDSGLESASPSWDKSVTEIKEHAYIKLEEELQHAREILKLRDEEVGRLRQMRQDGDKELLELTASLFEVS